MNYCQNRIINVPKICNSKILKFALPPKGGKANFHIFNYRFFAHIFVQLVSISFILPLFKVHCDYFEYKNFSGSSEGTRLMLEVGKANKSIAFKHNQQSN
jgi:hypothetical protein